ncbi:MAG TPA: glycosyltransferase [Solirubrobacteraceae bacterium]|nr:glycosyltransferase [Solirubrobacteraceae bacterium]
MIAFGCSVIAPDLYARYAAPGIERAREPGSAVFVHAAASSVARGCNLLFEQAARLPELEALVILHQDVEITDSALCAKLRDAFADPGVGVVGPVGAVGVRDIAWWDGTLTWSSAPWVDRGHRLLWPRELSASLRGPGEVETLYGVLMAFSPWVVRNLRFDESFGLLHGYDYDLCAQVREAGLKVWAADLEVLHHHSLDLVGQVEMWVEAHIRAAEKWDRQGPAPGEDEERYWRERARRAEADAAAARLFAASKLLQADATDQLHRRLLGERIHSRSWKLTEPLRRGNAWVRALRARVSARYSG